MWLEAVSECYLSSYKSGQVSGACIGCASADRLHTFEMNSSLVSEPWTNVMTVEEVFVIEG